MQKKQKNKSGIYFPIYRRWHFNCFLCKLSLNRIWIYLSRSCYIVVFHLHHISCDYSFFRYIQRGCVCFFFINRKIAYKIYLIKKKNTNIILSLKHVNYKRYFILWWKYMYKHNAIYAIFELSWIYSFICVFFRYGSV